MATDDQLLDVELSFTDWQVSCRDPSPCLRQCRRIRGHDGLHAAGFGAGRRRWADLAEVRDGSSH